MSNIQSKTKTVCTEQTKDIELKRDRERSLLAHHYSGRHRRWDHFRSLLDVHLYLGHQGATC